MTLITRIQTNFRQWENLAEWVEDDRLFGPAIEWIVVNDCPGNAPEDALRQRMIARKITLVEMPHNVGRSAARNAGARLATGTWLDFIDGDDRPLPLIAPATAADIVTFPVQHEWHAHDPHAIHGIEAANFRFHEGDPFLCELFETYQPVDWRPCSLLWRATVFAELLGFDARFETCEDIHLLWKALGSGRMLERMDQPKQVYRVTATSPAHRRKSYYGRLALLEAIAADPPNAAWRDDYRTTQRLLFWSAAEALRGLPGARKFFATEALKCLRRALFSR